MSKQHCRHVQLSHLTNDRSQTSRIICILGTVDSGDSVVRSILNPTERRRTVLHLLAHLHENVGHYVADEDCTARKALGSKALHCHLRRSQAQVGNVISYDAVVLLWHPAVERAQASFEMSERDVQFHRGKSRGERGIRVAVNKNAIGLMNIENFIHLCQDCTCLTTMCCRPYGKMHVGSWNFQVLEEYV